MRKGLCSSSSWEEGQEPELPPAPDTGRLSLLRILLCFHEEMLPLFVLAALECVTFIFVFILIRDIGACVIYKDAWPWHVTAGERLGHPALCLVRCKTWLPGRREARQPQNSPFQHRCALLSPSAVSAWGFLDPPLGFSVCPLTSLKKGKGSYLLIFRACLLIFSVLVT